MPALVVALMMLLPFQAFAQNRNVAATKTVSGKVVDTAGDPLPGTNILVKGTLNGTAAELDGSYSIKVAENDVLVFSIIGFATQEVAVAGKSTINVILEEDGELLEDVIVIGYGTAKKRDYIGSVSTIKSDDLAKVNPVSIESSLQGLAAGVQVNSANGVPGAPQQIKVRGVGSSSWSPPSPVRPAP